MEVLANAKSLVHDIRKEELKLFYNDHTFYSKVPKD
jgi:hypothetical protein